MRSIAILILALECGFASAAELAPGDDVERALAIDAPMYEDPLLAGPDTRVEFHPRLRPLWMEAMGRPELDLRLHAAAAIAEAHTRGYADLSDLAPTLAAKLDEQSHPLARLALIETLIRLDAASHADVLFTANQRGDRDTVLLTDPALANWKYAPAGELWRQRALDAAAPTAIRASAIHALGKLGDARFLGALQAVALDTTVSEPLRLSAARSFGEFSSGSAGLYETLERLHAGSVVDRLVGVLMMRALGLNIPERRVPLLLRYAGDASDAVAGEAMRQLIEIDPASVLSVQPDPFARDDAIVRLAAARSLHAHHQLPAVLPLTNLLDDRDPSTRRWARFALLEFDRAPELSEAVREHAMASFDRAGWRGLQQAALLLGKLRHEPAAPRLIELLTHERPETRVSAAVAVRWLGQEATLPAALSYATSLRGSVTADDLVAARAVSEQLVELFQMFGVMGYRDAEPLMRSFIPKSTPHSPAARGAAIWALGKLHEGQPDASLARELQSRLSDINPMNPEATEVRSASAVALGRMKATSAEQVLRKFLEEENASKEIGGACRWALEQITGQPEPPLNTLVERPLDWFLRPTE